MSPNTVLAFVQWISNASNVVSLPRVLRLYAIVLLLPLGVGVADAWGLTMTGATFSDLLWDVGRGGWAVLLSLAGGILFLAAADIDAKRARGGEWDRAKADAEAKREARSLALDPILAQLTERAAEARRATADPRGVGKS